MTIHVPTAPSASWGNIAACVLQVIRGHHAITASRGIIKLEAYASPAPISPPIAKFVMGVAAVFVRLAIWVVLAVPVK
jgi:hypothetical protein